MDGTARASPHRGRAESRLGRLRCRDRRAARLGKTLSHDKSPWSLGSPRAAAWRWVVALPSCGVTAQRRATRYVAQVRHVPKRPLVQTRSKGERRGGSGTRISRSGPRPGPHGPPQADAAESAVPPTSPKPPHQPLFPGAVPLRTKPDVRHQADQTDQFQHEEVLHVQGLLGAGRENVELSLHLQRQTPKGGSRAIWHPPEQACPTRKGESAADRRWHSRQMSRDMPDGSRSRAPRPHHL